VEGPSGRTIWEKLSNCSDEAVANFLKLEHPQTAAVVVSKLRADKAARVLERFSPAFARDVMLRLGRVHRLDSSVLEDVKKILYRDFLGTLRREQATRKPADVIGNMMNFVSSDPRGELLEHLKEARPELAEEVQRVMFTFPDIATRVNPREVGAVLKEVDNDIMMTALKTARAATPRVVEFILTNISKRMAAQIEEDIESMPPIKARDGETAQAEVIRTIQAMAARGDIQLIEPDSGDAMI
jgi:flagellar motor switch protein FliG